MNPTALLWLALAVPAAPAPKVSDVGLTKDLVSLIPEDTAGVLVVDLPKLAKSEIGAAAIRMIVAGQKADEPIQLAEFVKDAELVVVAQFLIDKGFGDFCILVRHREKSDVPKALIDRADKAGKNTAPEQVGRRTVYSLGDAGASFTRVDDRTLMFVLATGNEKQVKETRAAAYTERDKPGPSAALRKMLEADAKDDRAVRLYGSHPTKLGLSTWLTLAAFGLRDEPVAALTDKIVSYRGGIKVGDAGEIELRITTKDADAAQELLKLYEAAGGEKDPFVTELRATAKAVRDGEDVVIAATLTRATVELMGTRPNK